jgi:hypothetical protein
MESKEAEGMTIGINKKNPHRPLKMEVILSKDEMV